jgi:hypothetical protein
MVITLVFLVRATVGVSRKIFEGDWCSPLGDDCE